MVAAIVILKINGKNCLYIVSWISNFKWGYSNNHVFECFNSFPDSLSIPTSHCHQLNGLSDLGFSFFLSSNKYEHALYRFPLLRSYCLHLHMTLGWLSTSIDIHYILDSVHRYWLLFLIQHHSNLSAITLKEKKSLML